MGDFGRGQHGHKIIEMEREIRELKRAQSDLIWLVNQMIDCKTYAQYGIFKGDTNSRMNLCNKFEEIKGRYNL
jgi:hypothetical protein